MICSCSLPKSYCENCQNNHKIDEFDTIEDEQIKIQKALEVYKYLEDICKGKYTNKNE